MRLMNPALLVAPRKRDVGVTCEHAGCSNWTKEGKSLCPDHVQELPYVIQIRQQLEQRVEEDRRVAELGAKAVRLDGMTVEEILLQLAIHGSRSVERLARDTNTEYDTMLKYAAALRKARLVTFTYSKRGATILHPKLPMLSPEFREADAATTKSAMKKRASA